MKVTKNTNAITPAFIKEIGIKIQTFRKTEETAATMKETLTAIVKDYFKFGGKEAPLRKSMIDAGVPKQRVSDTLKSLGYHKNKPQSKDTAKAKASAKYDAKVQELMPALKAKAKNDKKAMIAIAYRLWLEAKK